MWDPFLLFVDYVDDYWVVGPNRPLNYFNCVQLLEERPIDYSAAVQLLSDRPSSFFCSYFQYRKSNVTYRSQRRQQPEQEPDAKARTTVTQG